MRALAHCDINQDGHPELLVGSDDFEIRAFAGEETVAEVTEVGEIVGLVSFEASSSRYGYAVSNGTIGVYDATTQVWCVKKKHRVTAVTAYDLDGDGVLEIVTGWSNGEIEVRKDHNGKVVYREFMGSAIAGLIVCDYKMDGRNELMCVCTSGEVRGYLPPSKAVLGMSVAQNATSALQDKVAERAMELRALEEKLKASRCKVNAPTRAALGGDIPSDTTTRVELEPNFDGRCLEIVASTSNATVVRSILVFSTTAGIFIDSECHMVYTKKNQSVLREKLPFAKIVEAELDVRVIIAARGSHEQLSVFNHTIKLGTFSTFFPPRGIRPLAIPKGHVVFTLKESMDSVVDALRSMFTADHNAVVTNSQNVVSLTLVDVRTLKGLVFNMKQNGDGVEMCVYIDDIALAGTIVQAIAACFRLSNLQSTCDFPEDMKHLEGCMRRVDECNGIRRRLASEMADNSQYVKTLVIRAEDCRLIDDMASLKVHYQELHGVNNEMIAEYNKRANNHAELLSSLKEVNRMISRASELRCGEHKVAVISGCRAALKSKTYARMYECMRNGK